VALKIDCQCGETVRGDSDDELVANAEEHMRERHPEMVGTMSREQILGMAIED
jgi:predicted small metal-binding protein